MRKRFIPLTLLATLALNSCDFISPPLGINPPADLVAACDKPAPLADDTLGSVADTLIANTDSLVDCGKRHKQLSDWVSGK